MRTAMLAVLLVLAAAGTARAQDAVVTGAEVARVAFCDNGVMASLSDAYHRADWQELQKKIRALLEERLASDPPPLEESAGCPLASAENGAKGSDDRHVFDPRRNVYLVVFLTKQGHVARVPVYDPVPEAFTNVLPTEGGKNGRPLYEVVLLRYAADSLASTYVVSTAADPAAAELGALAKAAVEISAAALDEIRPFQAFMAFASQARDSLTDTPPPPDPPRLDPRILVRKVSVPPFQSATVVVKDVFSSAGGLASACLRARASPRPAPRPRRSRTASWSGIRSPR